MLSLQKNVDKHAYGLTAAQRKMRWKEEKNIKVLGIWFDEKINFPRTHK